MKRVVFVFDFDGVLVTSINEPLLSSFKAFGLEPSSSEVDYYLNNKNKIHSIEELHNACKILREDFKISLTDFQSKIFSYRSNNCTSKKYCSQFKPTLLILLLKFLERFCNCFIVTSRDSSTVKRILSIQKIKTKNIISNTEQKKSKAEIINSLSKIHSKIIFMDDMEDNFKGIRRKIKTIRVYNFKNRALDVLMKTYVILKCIQSLA